VKIQLEELEQWSQIKLITKVHFIVTLRSFMFLGLKQDFLPDQATPIDLMDRQWSLVNEQDHFYLLSNVCPHQYSKILSEPKFKLKCPYHGFEFDITGKGLNNNCELEHRVCYTSGNLVFDQPVDYCFPIDTSNFVLEQYRCDHVRASVAVIMDVFLDIDHIPVAHPGVYDEVGIADTSNINYKTFANGSIQLVPGQSSEHMIEDDKQLGIGACWMALYPGTMIEWQPGALFVTVAQPLEHGSKVNVFKYRDNRYPMLSWNRNTVVWETAWAQDRSLSENIIKLGKNNLDPLKQHHRDWHALQK